MINKSLTGWIAIGIVSIAAFEIGFIVWGPQVTELTTALLTFSSIFLVGGGLCLFVWNLGREEDAWGPSASDKNKAPPAN